MAARGCRYRKWRLVRSRRYFGQCRFRRARTLDLGDAVAWLCRNCGIAILAASPASSLAELGALKAFVAGYFEIKPLIDFVVPLAFILCMRVSKGHLELASQLRESLRVNNLACRQCGSPTIVFPKVIWPASAIICAKCNAFISTLSEFRLAAEPHWFGAVSTSTVTTDLRTTDLRGLT